MIITKKMDLGKLFSNTKKNLLFLIITCTITFVSLNYVNLTDFKGLSYPTGLIGTALAFLIGFRNNSAYDRWWEARKIWGKLVNDSRHFSLKVISYISTEFNENLTEKEIEIAQKRLVYRHIAFVWSVNKHLRKLDWKTTLAPFMPKEEFEKLEHANHIPLTILKNQALDLKSLHEKGYIENFRYLSFDSITGNFNDALGKSERIKNTVFPMQYNWFMQYAIWVFLTILPFSLAGHVGLWFLPVTFLIGFVFILLEYLGRQIENPFENHPNDTPIDALSRTIEINMKEVLGETNLPSPIELFEGRFLL